MKTIHYISSALVAAGSLGVAALTLTHFIPADFGFAGLVTLGLAGLVLFDYSRPVAPLTVPATILRPALPSESSSPIVHVTRRAA